ncbi:MAG: peptide chain release factor 2 [Anaerolineales bacterium]|nr:peptide chain release factor 2 [Anaerolineales bacterium]
MEGLIGRLNEMRKRIENLMERLDIPQKEHELNELEAQSTQADFWNQAAQAQSAMQRIAKLRREVEQWQHMVQDIRETLELAELRDTSLESDIAEEVKRLSNQVEKMSFQAMLSGEYDNENAILAIHAGAGGTDAQDWAGMLARMYLRWAELHRCKIEIVDEAAGEEAGIKSIMLALQGDWVYGYLKSERGVHRLVRISPFDANSRRHTSFALVEVWPDIQDEIEIDINEKDLQIDTFRAGGAGGQHVQKNDTAVRITHLPTGIVVSCQNQRSQLQNLNRAMQVLKARLLDIERQKREEEFAQLKGEHVSAGWGNQIRSYVQHPYQLVKDLRTQHETGRVDAILDGELDEFMEAYLRYRVGQ